MISWWLELRTLIEAEFDHRPKVASFASVDGQGRPRVRSVVCREIGDRGQLLFASDARSQKNTQILARSAVEVCFWLADHRQQFRIAGQATILSSQDRRRSAIWSSMTDSARALFAWPDPGVSLDANPSAFPRAIGADQVAPKNFEIIELEPDEVDHLDLTGHPHRRRRWRLVAGWEEQPINP